MTAGPEAEPPDQAAGQPGDGRRWLAYTVVVCLVGAGLALFSVTRVWSVLLTPRPGLSALRAVRTGAQVVPWVTAVALVGLAGAGALLATRGRTRRAVGVLLALAGAATAVGAVLGRVGLDPGAAGARAVAGPAGCLLGGVLVTLGGWWTIRNGHRWPAMGARYERRAPYAQPGDDPAGRDQIRLNPVDTRAAWEALDRGDDPTLR